MHRWLKYTETPILLEVSSGIVGNVWEMLEMAWKLELLPNPVCSFLYVDPSSSSSSSFEVLLFKTRTFFYCTEFLRRRNVRALIFISKYVCGRRMPYVASYTLTINIINRPVNITITYTFHLHSHGYLVQRPVTTNLFKLNKRDCHSFWKRHVML